MSKRERIFRVSSKDKNKYRDHCTQKIVTEVEIK